MTKHNDVDDRNNICDNKGHQEKLYFAF